LAGAFGTYINPKKAEMIGLIPPIGSENVISIGNTALSGAKMALLSVNVRKEARELTKNLTYVELGAEPCFNEELVSATYFPHKNLDRC
jgi:uncharacterized 2Fe-2S/4Fe-4S cluster protein (DUF4445 family)